MKMLLIEPWFGGSHRAWAEGYAAASTHDVELVSLPGERWKWRLRGGAIELASLIPAGAEADVILVSGMTDVAVLRSLLPPGLSRVPIVVYQHESQMLYPTPDGLPELDLIMANVNSWLAADLVLFNSEFHRAAARRGLVDLVGRVQSEAFEAAIEGLGDGFEVMPVGVDLAWTRRKPAGRAIGRPRILWPHRWDNDKDPEAFRGALRRLVAAGLDFGLVLAGEEGCRPELRGELAAEFADYLVAAGPFGRDRYRDLVLESDIVVSCTNHEFFGVSVVEATAAGCWPVLPNDLSYPEIIGAGHPGLYERGHFGSALETTIRAWPEAARGGELDLTRFDWSAVAPALDARLAQPCPSLRVHASETATP